MKKYLGILMIGLFTMHNAYCDPMPQYKINFTIQPETHFGSAEDPKTRILVLRYYQAWGDGSSTGWQTRVPFPTVTLNGAPVRVYSSFHYSPVYYYGAIDAGYDQYAQYLEANLPTDSSALGSVVTVTGDFQQVAYLSATLYTFYNGTGTQQEIIDKDMPTLAAAKNPYMPGNPSVFAYPPAASMLTTSDNTSEKLQYPALQPNLRHVFFKDNTGEIGMYRLDAQDSIQHVAEDIAPDGCSRAYLIGQKDTAQEVEILRIKVPSVFIENDNPSKVFGNYQARYFSVSSNRVAPLQTLPQIYLSYWTVNTRMLKKYVDKDGYAYVFFAPDWYTHNLALKQRTPHTQPPVMTWGQYKGYILGDPSYAIILRYRTPDPAWKGNPENAKCYPTPQSLQPVTKTELGDYTPEVYGDSLANFDDGHIGAVKNNAPWPE